MAERFELDSHTDNPAPMPGLVEIGYQFNGQSTGSISTQQNDGEKKLVEDKSAQTEPESSSLTTKLEQFGIQFGLMAITRRASNSGSFFRNVFGKSSVEETPSLSGHRVIGAGESGIGLHATSRASTTTTDTTEPEPTRLEDLRIGLRLLLGRGIYGVDHNISMGRVLKDHLGPALLPKSWQRWEKRPLMPVKEKPAAQEGGPKLLGGPVEPKLLAAPLKQLEGPHPVEEPGPRPANLALLAPGTLRITGPDVMHVGPTEQHAASRIHVPPLEEPVHRPIPGRPIRVHPTGPEQVERPAETPGLIVRNAWQQRADEERARMAEEPAARPAAAARRTRRQPRATTRSRAADAAEPTAPPPEPAAVSEPAAPRAPEPPPPVVSVSAPRPSDAAPEPAPPEAGGASSADLQALRRHFQGDDSPAGRQKGEASANAPVEPKNMKYGGQVMREIRPAEGGQAAIPRIQRENGTWDGVYETKDGLRVEEKIYPKGMQMPNDTVLANEWRVCTRSDGHTFAFERKGNSRDYQVRAQLPDGTELPPDPIAGR